MTAERVKMSLAGGKPWGQLGTCGSRVWAPPQAQEHGGAALTTGQPLRGLCLQRTSGACLPLTGSAAGPGPSALSVGPALDPEAPLSSSLTQLCALRHLIRAWGGGAAAFPLLDPSSLPAILGGQAQNSGAAQSAGPGIRLSRGMSQLYRSWGSQDPNGGCDL